ncbi:PREDICTED: probable purine permease 9 [Ipomoea nil]|uniref:probable purine permease 9 n=1 Tax=Ipomoea nil TaxID=35883 RepID=UPI00090125CE|nr:PREDICTED: probable purine permease 9 [Ipomoea nil]
MAVGDIPEMKSQLPPGEEAKEENDINANDVVSEQSRKFWRGGQYKWWAEMGVYSIFVLSGQSIGTLLGRLYFDKGGNSKWMATLVQVVGFPVLIPLLFLPSTKTTTPQDDTIRSPSPTIVAPLYVFLGLSVAVNCMLYTVGIEYLPVTTYSLICASQLGFNALFSFFLNAQKFTPYIVNSLVLLTLSSTLLVLQPGGDGGDAKTSRRKYIIGFVSTLAASAGYALLLSLTQLAFSRIFKKAETFRLVIEMTIYQSAVASAAIVAGLFASGEWRRLGAEMDGFELGKTSYVMNLTWTAVGWQFFSVGCIGLIFKVSSLFSNVISILGLPIPPVLAVFILNDKMNGVKVISMVLAIWGFVSYIYQHYLDDVKEKAKAKAVQREQQVSQLALVHTV